MTFVALAVGDYMGTVGFTRLGGGLGLGTALLAWCASFAVVANATHGRTMLPVWPQ